MPGRQAIQPPKIHHHQTQRQKHKRRCHHRQEPVVAPHAPAPVLRCQVELAVSHGLKLGGLVRSTREHRAGSPRTLAQLGAVAGVRPLDLAPGGVYLAAVVTCDAGGLLHHPFTLTLQPKLKGGLLSVALSRGSPRVGVTDHPALWSPDLPHRATKARRDRPADSPVTQDTTEPTQGSADHFSWEAWARTAPSRA